MRIPPESSGMLHQSRLIGLSLLIAFAILMLSLLVGPRVPYERQTEFCVVNVHIAGPFGVSIICDSPEYLRLAREPSALLEPHNLRQSRPGLVLLAAVLVAPLSPLANLAQRFGISASRADIDQSRINNALATDFPGYVVYVALNASFVLLSFYLFHLIGRPPKADPASAMIFVSVCFLVAAVDPLKPFLWSPHNQMFNILAPIFAVWASLRASEGAMTDLRYVLLVGLIAGFGSTAYPLFIIVLPCVLVASLVAAFGATRHSALAATILNFFLLFLLTMLPETLWYLFVRAKTGGFYQYEMEHDRLVVWMFDAWQQGARDLVEMWLGKFWALMAEAIVQMAPVAALLPVLAYTLFSRRGALRPTLIKMLPLALCCLMVTLVTNAFYATAGYVSWRLAFAIIPPLIVGVGTAIVVSAEGLPERQRWIAAYACTAITLVQSIVLVVKNGPYS